MSKVLYFTKTVATSLCGLILIKDYAAEMAVCEGESMLPTLNSKGDVILVEKFSVPMGNLKRGDIIIAASPEDPRKLICKRIVGMENDVVTISDGFFSSNRVIPKGYVWIEGDNAARSHDSRAFGPIPYGLLRGKAVCKVWPPHQFGQGL